MEAAEELIEKPEKAYKEYLNVKFLLLAALVGLLSAGFTYLVDLAGSLCAQVYHYNGNLMYVYTPVIFIVIVFLLKKYFPYSDGSGLPQGYAVDVFDNQQIANIYSIKTAIGKVILTFLSILGGASLGKEGPTIQLCSSLFNQFQNISDQKRRLLIKLGAGVGVAAAFNTPLGGMIFAIEEYVRKVSSKIASLLVGATLVAVAVCNYFQGNEPYLGRIDPANLAHGHYTGFIAILVGVTCGLCGALFTKCIVFVSVNRTWFVNRWRKNHFLLNALIFGLIVALIGNLTHGLSFGNGSINNKIFLDSGSDAPWYYAMSKFFGAIASVGAGVPGGYFSTALSIGAGIGDLIYHFLPSISLAQFYLLGMTAFLAAITQSPITAVAMVVEMSNTSDFCLPILIAGFIASVISEQFGDSVYHQQVLNYIPADRYKETVQTFSEK